VKANTIFKDMGRNYTIAKEPMGLDYRGLAEVGIKPSAHLSVIRA